MKIDPTTNLELENLVAFAEKFYPIRHAVITRRQRYLIAEEMFKKKVAGLSSEQLKYLGAAGLFRLRLLAHLNTRLTQ